MNAMSDFTARVCHTGGTSAVPRALKLIPKILLVISIVVSAHAEQMAELRLVNGKVFSNVTVIRLEQDRAILRTGSASFPLLYAMIAEPTRTRLLSERDQNTKSQAEHSTASKIAPKHVVISGSAFSGGMEQPYKFAGMKLQLITKEHADQNRTPDGQIKATSFTLEAETDADGRFSLEVPSGSYVILARQLRSYRNGNRVPYEWRVEVDASKSVTVTLNDSNAIYRLDEAHTAHPVPFSR